MAAGSIIEAARLGFFLTKQVSRQLPPVLTIRPLTRVAHIASRLAKPSKVSFALAPGPLSFNLNLQFNLNLPNFVKQIMAGSEEKQSSSEGSQAASKDITGLLPAIVIVALRAILTSKIVSIFYNILRWWKWLILLYPHAVAWLWDMGPCYLVKGLPTSKIIAEHLYAPLQNAKKSMTVYCQPILKDPEDKGKKETEDELIEDSKPAKQVSTSRE
ncbi:hypothetical protein K488DRAFT_91022 [Vararia minispora EC-137]|uniref:Uncharacterized protein n=1 Tax=Vararia minispora EC-137 TaxID=1314806 RepID=A0ACB8Q6N0_9AGAM|nr:hypothetical protein K488DRAFT_91022 [Vararia minispora EC-137]